MQLWLYTGSVGFSCVFRDRHVRGPLISHFCLINKNYIQLNKSDTKGSFTVLHVKYSF